MSSSKPHKSHSGSVHDSDSESSIEYVQTQSPLSPNIPLTAPITSSMNVSGLNIDVGNPKAQISSTWSIPNISVTPILLNPTNTQMDNPVASQNPFGRSKQPNLNIQSGLQVHVGNEEQVDGGQQKIPLENVTWSGLLEVNPGLTLHQNMAPKGNDELYESSPVGHKEKVTGRHHPYASKPRMGHSSSSREKLVDDEDENMSPTQSETNDESRRDNFMAHEQGTQSNSEFTHP
ncbi:hypothetical protein O181_065929 [Austropuccinia psidii MF-1]|uniref:Uncharacterized protein n=1 Tax=Austropuccinia psidii MF-1 TaxID=1389203 RepID=A0A9Q3ES05_9BASI|nr:hypothetical protein [Austropuccinia psidii MF-1]